MTGARHLHFNDGVSIVSNWLKADSLIVRDVLGVPLHINTAVLNTQKQ
jgi:hypothetical protein